MPATNRKTARADKRLPFTVGAIRRVRNAPRVPFTLSKFLGLILIIVCSFGCAPSSTGGGQQNQSSASDETPEITDEKIRQEINDVYIREVPEENGAGEPISWRIDDEEPKEFTVVEKQMKGDRAIIILDIKTRSSPGSRSPKYLAGQIRTEWELQTGWALRKWEIVESENVSMKYKNLPKPPAQNSNR